MDNTVTANRGSVTMADVARHAGVSRTTVSFVLSDRQAANIPEETRARVLAAVAELGYRPNAGARALAAQRTRLVGLITDVVTTPFGAGIIRGAQHQARLQGQSLLIASINGDPVLDQQAVETMLEHRVEGLLCASGEHRAIQPPPNLTGVPTIFVHCFDAEGRLPSVLPDEVGGGYVATRRLTDAGHRRIGFINLDPHAVAAKGRLEGYLRALREAGVEPDGSLVRNGHATADGGYEQAAILLDSANPPTALFCGTDRMAMGAYDAIKERGLSIPGDVAVVGFDDQEVIAGYLRPGLTTVALPFEEMGARGVELLGSQTAEQSTATESVTIDCPLVERSSV
jgi:LacI family transcriptional regulator